MWAGVSRSERRRIKRAVRRGELLDDPDEAEKLVEVAWRFRLKRPRPGRLPLISALALVAVGVTLALADPSRRPLWFTVLAVILALVQEPWKYVDRRRMSDRWERAEARHIEYLRQLGFSAWRRPAG